MTYILIRIADLQLAIPVQDMVAMTETDTLKPYPQHDWILGTTEVLGETLPVIDLQKWMELPVSLHVQDPRIIVIQVPIQEHIQLVGAIVESSTEIIDVRADQLQSFTLPHNKAVSNEVIVLDTQLVPVLHPAQLAPIMEQIFQL